MAYSHPAAYEQFMGRWSVRLAPSFLLFAGVRDGQNILDVGCGTGSLSRAVISSGLAVKVTGVDPVTAYLSFARETVPHPRMQFQAGSAEALPFPDHAFDAAVALLVLQDFNDPDRAVREMARVTRPNGIVAACLWDFRDGMPMFSLFWHAAEAVALHAVARRRAERPPTSLGLQTLVELWTGAGLTDVRTTGLELSQEFSSFEDFWLPFLGGSTPTCEFAIALNEETRGKLATTLRRIIPGVRPDGSFVLPARALAVAGIVGH